MATVKNVILKHQKKSDNTWNVKLRITHNRQSVYIPTVHYVPMDLINKKTFELKQRDNPVYDDIMIDEARIRKELSSLGRSIENFSAKMLGEHINNFLSGKPTQKINFFDYGYRVAKEITDEGRAIGNTYAVAVRQFERFTGSRDFSFSDITRSLLEKFEAWLREKTTIHGNKMTNSGIRLYMITLQTIFTKEKKEYNDEDRNLILIPNSPFSSYTPPKSLVTKKRALTVEQILAIRDYQPSLSAKKTIITRDVFIMSILLVGMNTADLFAVEPELNGRFSYERQKTRTRRTDRAFISIKIEPELRPYLDKYKDISGGKAFNFFTHYFNYCGFNKGVNLNLKKIGAAVGIDNLTYYAARHSWATIARNECGISMDDVAMCLNHKSGHDVTDTYIKKDWSVIDKANRKVIDYIFGGKDEKQLPEDNEVPCG